MKNYNHFNNGSCPPPGFVQDCCNQQTVPVSTQQQQQLLMSLNALVAAISAFFADPNNANRLTLIDLFN